MSLSVKLTGHEPLDQNERYIASMGEQNESGSYSNSEVILAITDVQDDVYTCFEELEGEDKEDYILEALGMHEHGEPLDQSEPVDERYHSQTELEIIRKGLEDRVNNPEDELVEEKGVSGAFEALEQATAEKREANTTVSSSAVAAKRARHFDYM